MTRRFLFGALLLAAGCSTAEQVGRQVARAVPGGRAVLADWDRYSKIARVLVKYHDSGTLDQGDLMNVLYGAGVLKAPPPRIPGRPAPKKPPAAPPFPVPAYDGAYRWPLAAGVVSSEYGRRWGRQHHGIDIAADRGAPVYAAAPGKVLYAGDRLRGYGNVVIVRHDEQTVTLYAHNDTLKVGEFQQVRANQVISTLGNTGRSTGPHVHFEFRVGNQSVDPRTKLPQGRF